MNNDLNLGGLLMFENYNDIMSVNEIAEALHCSRNRVYELLESGQLKGFRLGHVWKINKSDFIKFCTESSAR